MSVSSNRDWMKGRLSLDSVDKIVMSYLKILKEIKGWEVFRLIFLVVFGNVN